MAIPLASMLKFILVCEYKLEPIVSTVRENEEMMRYKDKPGAAGNLSVVRLDGSAYAPNLCFSRVRVVAVKSLQASPKTLFMKLLR